MLVRLRLAALAVAVLFACNASAQSSFVAFSGAPASIGCATTGFSLNGGNLTFSWSLPSGNSSIAEIIDINGSTAFSVVAPLPAAQGSLPLSGPSPPYGPVSFPYSVVFTVQPQAPGVPPAAIRFLCPAAGPATNFSILNGSPAPVPATSPAALLALAALLGLAAMLARRGLLAHGPR